MEPATDRRSAARQADRPMAPELVARLRKQYEGLISDLLGEGLTDAGYAVADTAVAQGLWPERLHRPIELHPTTQSRPFLDPADFWFTSHLERHWDLIRAEIDAIEEPARAGFSTAGMDGSSVRGGRWHQLMLWDRGRRFERACGLLPGTAEVLSAIPDVTAQGTGFVMVSWLEPGTWIAPHCGPTNVKARTHFCVRGDARARIRVGDQVRGWDEGRCFVFDDSYEHEVWHDGEVPRVVLILDAPNPYLVDGERVVRQEQANRADEMLTFMTAMRLRRITRVGADVKVTFAPSMVEFIRSYLETRQLESVELRQGVLRVRAVATPGGEG
ncbi:aspartyl/asparaginyl beta-hydroxylase domain-containing protein [Plantactinospora sp. CA-294935]|uniref:aspartyl/asparaginyl beta-hydroxylase domain-containing protein n=1 Tax=Plantactinospora sp. CA-294935 TaxID=3240012 RepID=UPI003D93A9C0